MGRSSEDPEPGTARARRDRGQVTPLLALLVVVAAIVVLGVAQFGAVVIDRAQARTAADAAALAAVDGGRDAADRLAAANHGVVERFVASGGDTEVTVRVGRARATARARPGSPGRSAVGDHGR